jgi:membrane fusion protein, copper/silver efflux system
MKKLIVGGVLLVMLGGAFLLGAWSGRRAVPPPHRQSVRKVLYYVDPMHPAYTSDKPGIAPDCGMELVPVYEDEAPSGIGTQASMSPPGAVSVSAASQQVIGVRVATAEKVQSHHALRVLGRIAPDETRVYRINAATDGWIKKVLPVTTNSQVQQDELLGTFYAPEFFSAMKAYLYGLRSVERFEANRKEPKEQG